jgi:hypothetical protein
MQFLYDEINLFKRSNKMIPSASRSGGGGGCKAVGIEGIRHYKLNRFPSRLGTSSKYYEIIYSALTSMEQISFEEENINYMNVYLPMMTSVVDRVHQSFIFLVCQHGHVDVMKHLLLNPKNNFDIMLKGHSILHHACHSNHIDIVKALLNSRNRNGSMRINVNRVAPITGDTVLHLACLHSSLEVVEALLGLEEIRSFVNKPNLT